MLNKFFLSIITIFSAINAYALNTNQQPDVVIKPVSLIIREPFTALAIANLQITNNTPWELKITELSSKQARHVDVYEKVFNDFGAEQIKKVKDILIPGSQTTEFNTDNFQIRFTGLERKYLPGDEVELTIKFNTLDQVFTTYLPVYANYN